MAKIFKKFSRWMHYNPPGALSGPGWNYFNREFKKVAPVRYYLTHTLRRKVTLPIRWKIEKVVDWVRYRTISRYNIVDSGLPPGYYNAGNLMFHSAFSLLKDYVEIELACRLKKDYNWAEKYIPFYNEIVKFRSPALGIENLNWQSSLDDPASPNYNGPTQQAVVAREILFLYNWWVNERPARVELKYPSTSISDEGDDDFFLENDLPKEYAKRMKEIETQKADWDREDTEMFIRLVEIRDNLWT